MFRKILDRLHQPNLLERLGQRGIDESQIAALRSFITRAADREVYRANPRLWAERLGLDERDALALIVAGAAEAVLDLTWQTTCPVCRYYGRAAQSLGGLVGLHECAQCDHRYEATLDEDAFVTVSVSDEVRRLSPTRRDDPVFRTVVDARYGPVSALALINTPAFRELLAQQALPEGQSLGVKRLAIFFSDLRCSTAFYQKFGDAAAYRIVCRHFLSVFGAINRHGGAAVKTIGDGIMGVFPEPDAALRGIAEAVVSLERISTEAGLDGNDRTDNLDQVIRREPLIQMKGCRVRREIGDACRIQASRQSHPVACGDQGPSAPASALGKSQRPGHSSGAKRVQPEPLALDGGTITRLPRDRMTRAPTAAQLPRRERSLSATEDAGSSGRTRTYNPPVNSRLLCRLSYRGRRRDYTGRNHKASSFMVCTCLKTTDSGGEGPRETRAWPRQARHRRAQPTPGSCGP